MQTHPQYQPLVDAIYEATGRRPHLTTALRWCLKGTSGIKLESWKVGGRRVTTVDAVEAFVAATTAASGQRDGVVVATSQRVKSAHLAAMRSLDAEGI